MSIPLTDIFDNEIIVNVQNWRAQRNYVGFPGANGLLSTYLGTRGYVITVTGRLWASGTDYETARSNLQTIIDEINEIVTWYDDDYTHAGCNYESVVWDVFDLVPIGDKFIRWDGASCHCNFIAQGRSLV